MARAQQSKIGSIVSFFRSAPLEVMDLAFDLVRDEVNGRRLKSREAKARAATPTTPAHAAETPTKRVKAARKAKGVRKPHKKRLGTSREVEPGLPLDALTQGTEVDAADATPRHTLSTPTQASSAP
jgi:hypothetical protein